jgi:hypothetical protein
MVQRGRADSNFSIEGNGDFRPNLYEGCQHETGCGRAVVEHCGCRKGFCNIHIRDHKIKTHRFKKKS